MRSSALVDDGTMAKGLEKCIADVAIVGGGPGGCTVLREMARRNKRAILVEKGGARERLFGTPLGCLLRMEKAPTLPLPVRRTREGDPLVLGQGLGGGTAIFAGSAFLPDRDYWRGYGIDLEQDLVDEAMADCWVNMPPDEFIGPGTRRLRAAADEVGIAFQRQHRHVDFDRCVPGCAKCTYGCPTGAKWTAKVFADEAMRHGAKVLTDTKVTGVVVERGVARGLRARTRAGRVIEIEAPVVVCAAGAVHTAELLRQAGLEQAGSWLTGDPTVFSFGFVDRKPGNGLEHGMTVGHHDKQHGILLAAMLSPFFAWHLQLLSDEPLSAWRRLHRFGRALGVLAKVSDDGRGSVEADGQVSKDFTRTDRARLQQARALAQRILQQAGCDPRDIHHTRLTLGHPSGTVRVGELLDTQLQTPIQNLYCCDTSVMPKAPGQPPTLTLVVLAKRLARRLAAVT